MELKNTIPNENWIKGEIKKEIKIIPEMDGNETIHIEMCMT